jgi:benzoylformate decarboxylase
MALHRTNAVIARSEATKVTDPGQLKSVLSSAISRPGAKLIEVVVSNSVN